MMPEMSWQRHVYGPTLRGNVAVSQEDFSRKMLALREQHLLSQEEAARRIGVATRTWARWEDPDPATGNVPRLSTLALIADEFKVPVTYFGINEADPDQLDRIEAAVNALAAQISALSGAFADHVAFTRAAVADRPVTRNLPEVIARIDNRQDVLMQALAALLPSADQDLARTRELLGDAARLLAEESAPIARDASATAKPATAAAKRRRSPKRPA